MGVHLLSCWFASARVGSRSFLERVAESARLRVYLAHSLCVLYVLVHTWMSNAESSAPLILLVTFCASRSVIAGSSARRVTSWLIADLYFRTLPDITTDPSTFGIDRRTWPGRPKRKEMYRTHNDRLKKYRFVIFLFLVIFFFLQIVRRSSKRRRFEFRQSDTAESYAKYRRIKERSISNTFETDWQRQ